MTDSILRSYYNVSSSTFVPFAQAAPPADLLLDTYTGAIVAYSLRKLSNAYAGSAVRIRRSSDNLELDVGFSGIDFDSSAAATHIGGGSGFIAKWYDQSGNGRDLVQSNASIQPSYVASGINSKPTTSSVGGGGNVQLETSASLSAATLSPANNCDAFSVIRPSANAGGIFGLFAWYGTNATTMTCPYSDDFLYFNFGSGGGSFQVGVTKGGAWDNNNQLLQWYRDGSNTQAIVVNGSSLVSATRTSPISGSSAIRVYDSGGPGFIGQCSEVIFWGSDLGSTDRTGVLTDLNAYYAVF